MKIVTKNQAKEQKLKRYYTGKECKRGHMSERFAVSRTCVQCNYLNWNNYISTTNGKVYHTRKANLRRLRKNNGEYVCYSVNQLSEKFNLFENKCAYCGSKENLTQDHFIPINKNGSHRIENIVPACKNCNCRKSDALPRYWYTSQTFYSKSQWDRIVKYTT